MRPLAPAFPHSLPGSRPQTAAESFSFPVAAISISVTLTAVTQNKLTAYSDHSNLSELDRSSSNPTKNPTVRPNPGAVYLRIDIFSSKYGPLHTVIYSSFIMGARFTFHFDRLARCTSESSLTVLWVLRHHVRSSWLRRPRCSM